jgi:hypothetical protein
VEQFDSVFGSRARRRGGPDAVPAHVEMVEFPSSESIDSAGYDPGIERLYIRFTTGRRYFADGVGASAFQGFLEAGSAGRHFNFVLKPAYEFTRM